VIAVVVAPGVVSTVSNRWLVASTFDIVQPDRTAAGTVCIVQRATFASVTQHQRRQYPTSCVGNGYHRHHYHHHHHHHHQKQCYVRSQQKILLVPLTCDILWYINLSQMMQNSPFYRLHIFYGTTMIFWGHGQPWPPQVTPLWGEERARKLNERERNGNGVGNNTVELELEREGRGVGAELWAGVTEGGVNSEREFRPLPLRSRALVAIELTNFSPEAETVAGDCCVDVVKVVATNRSPDTVVFDLQTSFTRLTTIRQFHRWFHVVVFFFNNCSHNNYWSVDNVSCTCTWLYRTWVIEHECHSMSKKYSNKIASRVTQQNHKPRPPVWRIRGGVKIY